MTEDRLHDPAFAARRADPETTHAAGRAGGAPGAGSSTGVVRVRFAPSPTGAIHVGNVRTALFNYLYARRHGGAFVLRLDDTDRRRHVAAAVAALYRDLRRLGLDWDEGPDVGGPVGPYRQSERAALYDDAVARILAEGRAFPCACSRAVSARHRRS